jgi:putative transposase
VAPPNSEVIEVRIAGSSIASAPSTTRNGRTHSSAAARPAHCYAPSPRPYPERLPPLEYPGHFIVKRITNAGTFRLKHKLLFLANPLKQQVIGLDETDDGIWSIYFGTVLLGKVDERDMIIRD